VSMSVSGRVVVIVVHVHTVAGTHAAKKHPKSNARVRRSHAHLYRGHRGEVRSRCCRRGWEQSRCERWRRRWPEEMRLDAFDRLRVQRQRRTDRRLVRILPGSLGRRHGASRCRHVQPAARTGRETPIVLSEMRPGGGDVVSSARWSEIRWRIEASTWQAEEAIANDRTSNVGAEGKTVSGLELGTSAASSRSYR